jgi:putative polyhydroxyalkanoate system protein
MTHPLKIQIPHQLGRAEARRRIETGFEKLLRQLPGRAGARTERWEGDRLTFSVATMGQTVSGTIDVLENVVTMEIELPGLLGQIASAFKGKLQKAGQMLLTKE